MNLVTAVIKPFKLEEVKEAIKATSVPGMTVTEVQGFGRQGGHTEVYRGAEYEVDFIAKVKVEVICDESDTAALVEAITEAAMTGKIGDGKIWVVPVLELVRIRTREKGSDAL